MSALQSLHAAAAATKDMPLCYKNTLRDPVSFIEFQPDGHTRCGFAVSQLLQYTLDTDPPKLNSQPAPPERLELGFSTADVIVRGARLALLLSNYIATNKLVTVQDCRRGHPGALRQPVPGRALGRVDHHWQI